MSDYCNFVMEIQDMETAASICKTSIEKKTIVKSSAQRQYEYRMRKKIEKQLTNPKKKPKTNAQNQQQFRLNQKKKQLSESSILARKKKDAARAKKYRDKLKSRKQCAELNSLLASKMRKEIDYSLDANCKELIDNQCGETQQAISPSFRPFQVPYEEHDITLMPNALLRHETNFADDDKSGVISACATGQTFPPTSSKVEEIIFEIEPLERQDKSKVIPACATSQSLLSAPAFSNEEEIFIEIEPLERQDESGVIHASSTVQPSLDVTATSKENQVAIKTEPSNTQDESKVILACATGQSVLSDPVSSNVEEIFIKTEPLETEDESGVIHSSSTGRPSLDATATSKEKQIPMRTEASNTQDLTDYWNKIRNLAVRFGHNPPGMTGFWASMEVPPLAPISTPVPTSVSETVSAKKATNETTAQNQNPPYRILCCICQKFSKGYTFVCVQCHYKACKECDDLANHDHHYVLRIPTKGCKEKIEAVVTKIDELVGSGTFLGADNSAKIKKGKKIAQQDTTLKTKQTPEQNINNNQIKSKILTITQSTNAEKTKVPNPHQDVETQYTAHVHKTMKNSQIRKREIAERIVIKNEMDTNCETEGIPTLNIKQESDLTEEEVTSLHTIKEEIDDPVELCETYLDATVPLSDHAYAVMASPLPMSQPAISVYDLAPSTSTISVLYQPSTSHMSGDEETDSANEVYF